MYFFIIMDKNLSKLSPETARMDSGFESTLNSISHSSNESGIYSNQISFNLSENLQSNQQSFTKHLSDDAVGSLEQAISGMNLNQNLIDDPNFDMVYSHWLVADNHGHIPFHTAVAKGEFDIVHNIIARCYFQNLLDMPDGTNLTPLVIAVMTQRPDIVRALVMYGADVTKFCHGQTALHIACKLGNPTMVDMLTKPIDVEFLKENPNLKQIKTCQSYINKINLEGMSPLHIAVQSGHLQIIKILIKELDCDVNHKDERNGDTSLNILIKNGGDIQILRYLLQHDVDEILLNFTTADLSIMTPEEDLAVDLACYNSGLARYLQLEMESRIAVAR